MAPCPIVTSTSRAVPRQGNTVGIGIGVQLVLGAVPPEFVLSQAKMGLGQLAWKIWK